MILMDQVGEKQPDAGLPAPAVFFWYSDNY